MRLLGLCVLVLLTLAVTSGDLAAQTVQVVATNINVYVVRDSCNNCT
jgi:hypothetical protein